MGACYLGGKKVGDVSSPAECREIGGTWQESSGGNGACCLRDILTRALGESILLLGETYTLGRDFKHQILKETELGRRFVGYLETHLDTTFGIIRGNFGLIGRSMETWLAILPFMQGMLEANGQGLWQYRQEYHDKVRFTRDTYRVVSKLIKEIREVSPSQEYTRILDELEQVLRQFVGLTPAKALKVLQGGLKGD